MTFRREESSFRDRDGFVFYDGDKVYRAVGAQYRPFWDKISNDDWFQALVTEKKVPAFKKEDAAAHSLSPDSRVLAVEKIPFVVYPSEWTFLQLKKAALLTLDLQLRALQNNCSLKDASAYNVQFNGNRPVFIDLFSFEEYKEGEPWIAYRQFCTHFLGPLLLAHYGIPQMLWTMSAFIDGLPLLLCSKLLPWRSRFNLLAATHIHLHARLEKKHGADAKTRRLTISRNRLVAMLSHMRDGIKSLKEKDASTNWTGYYSEFSYSDQAFQQKKEFVTESLVKHKPAFCLDLGCNTGEFSKIASEHCQVVVACDNDEKVLSLLQKKKLGNVTTLRIDLANPTPAYGWNSNERSSFLQRVAGAEFVLALALIHHLCISNNVPLQKLAEFFAGFAKLLLIEFVPKTDVQVKRLLVTRKDIFDEYDQENFLRHFSEHFFILSEKMVPGSDRVLFLIKNKHL